MTEWTREEISTKAERNLITGLIVSDDFYKTIKPLLLPRILTVPYMKTVAKWVIDFSDEFGKVPGREIQDIFQDKTKGNGFDPDEREFIERFLGSISEEYEQEGFTPDFQIQRAKQYIRERKRKLYLEDLEEANRSDNDAAFDEITKKYQAEAQAGQTKDLGEAVKTCTRPFRELAEMKIPKPRLIVGDWLRERGVYLISSPAGVGKTWFIMEVAAAAANYRDAMGGHWETRYIFPTLIVDGEMDLADIQERGRMVGLGKCEVLSKAELESQGVGMNLADEGHREALKKFILDRGFKLAIFDNLFSLFVGLDLNSATDWGPVNSWFQQFKAHGVTVILVHHTGHDKSRQTGTAAREFNIDLGIVLNDARAAEDGENCCFTIRVTKRRRASGLEGKRYRCVDGRWTVDSDKAEQKDELLGLLAKGQTDNEALAAAMGISKSRVSQLRAALAKDELIQGRGREAQLTPKGQEWLSKSDKGEF
jgi:hypothetical protein